jgi:cellulase
MRFCFIATVLVIQQAAGHALFQQLWVNGVDKSTTCVRMPRGNSPVSSVSSNDMRCNAGGTAGVSGKCAVNAGDTVTVEMHQVVHTFLP